MDRLADFGPQNKSRQWDAKAITLLAEITIVTRNFFHPIAGLDSCDSCLSLRQLSSFSGRLRTE